MLTLGLSFYYKIFTDFYKVNVRINFISVQDEHLLDWSNFLLDYPYHILHVKM